MRSACARESAVSSCALGVCNETIAATAQGLDRLLIAVGHELFAQIGDVGLDHVGVMLPVVVVEVLEQLALGDDDARPMHHVLKNAVFSRREIDDATSAAHCLFQRVDFDVGDGKNGMRSALAAANQSLRARDELAEVKGLAEIVISTSVEQLDGGGSAVLCGEDQDRSRVISRAQVPQDGQAIDLRQHQIQNDEVVASLPGQLLAYLAVLGAVDGEARAFAQSGGQIIR